MKTRNRKISTKKRGIRGSRKRTRRSNKRFTRKGGASNLSSEEGRKEFLEKFKEYLKEYFMDIFFLGIPISRLIRYIREYIREVLEKHGFTKNEATKVAKKLVEQSVSSEEVETALKAAEQQKAAALEAAADLEAAQREAAQLEANSPKRSIDFLMKTDENGDHSIKSLDYETIEWLNNIQTTWNDNKSSSFFFDYIDEKDVRKNKFFDLITNIRFLGLKNNSVDTVVIEFKNVIYTFFLSIKRGTLILSDNLFLENDFKTSSNVEDIEKIDKETVASLNSIYYTWKKYPNNETWIFSYKNNNNFQTTYANLPRIEDIIIDKFNNNGTVNLNIKDKGYEYYFHVPNFAEGDLVLPS
jgi:hypothetical protein